MKDIFNTNLYNCYNYILFIQVINLLLCFTIVIIIVIIIILWYSSFTITVKGFHHQQYNLKISDRFFGGEGEVHRCYPVIKFRTIGQTTPLPK